MNKYVRQREERHRIPVGITSHQVDSEALIHSEMKGETNTWSLVR